MLEAYFLLLGVLMVVALFIDRAIPSMCALLGSFAASFAAGRIGLDILAPYIDGLCFYALLLITLKSPTKENIRCVWLGAGLVAVHLIFNGTSVFIREWSVANDFAIAYMWTVNSVFLLQVWALIGGDHVRSLLGTAAAGLRSLVGDPPRRHHAHSSQAHQKAAP